MTPTHGSDSFTTADGTSISFTRHGASATDAPRIALAHSLALDRSIWDGVVRELDGAIEVLTYDCRGHGQSDRRPGPYTAQLFARDLAALFDHVGWERAAVAGCSMGGNVAQAFAAECPDRVTALGLIDTTAWYGADAAEKFQERADAAAAKGMRGLIGFQLTRWFSDAFPAAHPDIIDQLTGVFVANDVECYGASCALLGSVDMRPHLASFRMPVAVIVGEEDYATPVAMARHLHDALPHSTLTILPTARHLTPIECPIPIASELRGLLARTLMLP